MKSPLIIFLLCLILFSNSRTQAQQKVMKVWPDKIPGAIKSNTYQEEIIIDDTQATKVSKVTEPTITIYTPEKEKANGTAIIICPGGGYTRLAIDKEGFKIASWLSKQGITGILLKYRLPSDEIMKDKSVGPLQDAQEAIRIVRRNAAAWGINPFKIGIMGFSAGGHLASTASTHFNEDVSGQNDTTSARPDFSILIYPVISMDLAITHKGSRENLLGKKPTKENIEHFSNELQVNDETPPAFLALAADDSAVPIENSINYFLALKKTNIPAEMHIYEKGGHGFGLGKKGGTESSWPEACINWLRARKLIPEKEKQ
jgi:acetyl esterase/lipase